MATQLWKVFAGDDLVLEVSSQPGVIRSTAHLPPGMAPRRSAFMSATSHDAEHEDAFHRILEASRSVEEFLAGLRADGLRVVGS